MRKRSLLRCFIVLLAVIAISALPVSAAKRKKKASDITVKQFEKAVIRVCERAKKDKWTYGNSRANVPCSDRRTSCDRLVARALYDLGFKDQPRGGITVGNIESYCRKHKFKVSHNVKDIKRGSIVLVRNGNHRYSAKSHYCHAFVVRKFNRKTWSTTRWDFGNNSRIKGKQPIKEKGWHYMRDNICVINIPTK